MALSRNKRYKIIDGVKYQFKKLKPEQTIELLELSGQLLNNGYPAQDIIVFAKRLMIISHVQATIMQEALNNGSSLKLPINTVIWRLVVKITRSFYGNSVSKYNNCAV